MIGYYLTRDAQADLLEHWTYLGERNIQAATRLKEMIIERFEQLVDFPNLGRARPEFAGGYRSLPAGNYVIYYRVLETNIEIHHVLHGNADPTQVFEPAPDDAP